MAVNGFDFQIENNGELVLNSLNGDLGEVSENDLKLQLAFTRIKSCVNDWFYDEVGADLEELIGRAVKNNTVELGKKRIEQVLTYDELWSLDDIFIQVIVKDSREVIYAVYFRLYTDDEFGETSKSITVTLDLVKGVKVKYGWDPDNLYILN